MKLPSLFGKLLRGGTPFDNPQVPMTAENVGYWLDLFGGGRSDSNEIVTPLTAMQTANVAWMNMQKWKALADPSLSLDQFAGEPVWIGCDLSSSIESRRTRSTARSRSSWRSHGHWPIAARNFRNTTDF